MHRDPSTLRATVSTGRVWLSPEGEFFNGDAHENRADDILYYIYKIDNVVHPSDALEKLGWVRLTCTLIWDIRVQEGYFNRKYTQAQLNSMYDWCKEHNKQFPVEVEE